MVGLNKLKKPRGGARPNSGRKVGSKLAKTISKEQAREALRALVMEHFRPLIAAQVANAQGVSHFILRNKSGKFERVTNPDAILAAMNATGDERKIWEIWERDPNVQAFTDLMNRALDKPKEQEQDLNVRGRLLFGWMK